MVKEKQIYLDYIMQNNIKQSKQREFILDVFLTIEGHPTISEIFDAIKKLNDNIGIATIYRAMKIFCDAGLANEIDIGDSNKHYEHKFNHVHHDHLVCIKCGKITEFCSPIIEEVQQKICNINNFEMTNHELKIYGICASCKQ